MLSTTVSNPFVNPFHVPLYATMKAEDAQLYTLHAALPFVGRAPYPVWDGVHLDKTSAVYAWTPCGWWDERDKPQGYNMPETIARKMEQWLFAYARQHPRDQLIARSTATGRHVRCSLNELDALIRKHSPRTI